MTCAAGTSANKFAVPTFSWSEFAARLQTREGASGLVPDVAQPARIIAAAQELRSVSVFFMFIIT
jgi:hypothetical protein